MSVLARNVASAAEGLPLVRRERSSSWGCESRSCDARTLRSSPTFSCRHFKLVSQCSLAERSRDFKLERRALIDVPEAAMSCNSQIFDESALVSKCATLHDGEGVSSVSNKATRLRRSLDICKLICVIEETRLLQGGSERARAQARKMTTPRAIVAGW